MKARMIFLEYEGDSAGVMEVLQRAVGFIGGQAPARVQEAPAVEALPAPSKLEAREELPEPEHHEATPAIAPARRGRPPKEPRGR